MMPRIVRIGGAGLSCAAALLVGTWCPEAAAVTFDDRGVPSFDANAVFTEGFEQFTPGAQQEVGQGGALEGDKFLVIQSDNPEEPAGVRIPLGPSKRSYRFVAFLRGEASWYPIVRVAYGGAPGVPFSVASMSPTGRMTSDGWVEIATPPVSIDGTRAPTVELSVSSRRVEVDALEVVEDGPYQHNAPCSGLSSPACSQGQFCVHGYCHDGAAMVPPLPEGDARDLVVDLLKRKLEIFFGGVYTREVPMQHALATLDSMRDASGPWDFWNGFATAILRLNDSHTSPFGLPSYIARGGRAFPVCMVEGEADLSQSIAPSDPLYADVLVSHVGPAKNQGLKPGDRIVAVDGLHPIAWMQTLVGYSWGLFSASDPSVHGATVEQLATAIPAHATFIDVLRCGASSGTCAAPERIYTATFERDTEDTVRPSCDHRPAYHLAANNPDPVTHELDDVRFGLLEDSAPGEDLYGMIWNDTDWSYGDPNPWKDAYTAFRASAKGLILDHREGNGGTPEGAAYLTELSLHTKLVSVWSLNATLGLFDQPFEEADGLFLWDKWKSDPVRSWRVGSSSPRDDIRIAVLLARDVSGSDFFPWGVKGAANTRLFGRRTMGAFSTFQIFEMSSFLGWTLASGDFIDQGGTPQMGKGVEPDENLLPKESDLLVGRDTVYERALTWVRCGDGGC